MEEEGGEEARSSSVMGSLMLLDRLGTRVVLLERSFLASPDMLGPLTGHVIVGEGKGREEICRRWLRNVYRIRMRWSLTIPVDYAVKVG